MNTHRAALATLIFIALPAFSLLSDQSSSPAVAARRRQQQQQQPERQPGQHARIQISTSPDGTLSIDGQPAGETTDSVRLLELAPGEHTVAVKFRGGGRWSHRLSIPHGESRCIRLVYRPNSHDAAAAEATPLPTSTYLGAFRQGDISGSISDCFEMATPRGGGGGRSPASNSPIITQLPRPTPEPPQPTPEPPQPTLAATPMPEPVEIPLGSAPPPPAPDHRSRATRLPAQEAAPAGSRHRQQAEDKSGDEIVRPENRGYTIVPILYGTDRKRTGKPEPAEFYGARRGKLELGTCEVSIPDTHERGRLESPSVWRLEFKEDPKRHVVLLSVDPLDAVAFNAQFRARLGKATSRDVFVFVHGFNVKFVDAARRTAQLAHDLDFPGVPVLYSWPSQGTSFPTSYTTDANVIETSEPPLKQFLSDLAAEAGGDARIHLIAHSMGNRVLTKVLRDLARENTSPLFSEVILTAPDIDKYLFETQLAPAIQRIARHVTLYASSTDAALLASKEINGDQRAGDSFPEIIIVPGIDTIDASGIDTNMLGHSYFAQMKVVIDDIKMLMLAGKQPGERSLLEQLRGEARYWRLPGVIVVEPTGKRPPSMPGTTLLTVRNGLLLAAAVLLACALAAWFVLRSKRRTTG